MPKKKLNKKSNLKKTSVKPPSITDSINTEVIAAALSSANQPVLLKVCRLCEAKDGPFLNIFDADKVTAKKIEVVMPFRIAEQDDLPHKICFRCSAKVEELYEFIQKCIKTQENLRKNIPNKGYVAKPKHRELWEEKLNQSNISNDAICDALIKKAMEGIKDIPLNLMPNPITSIEDKTSVFKKTVKKLPGATKNEEDVQISNVIDRQDGEPINAINNAKLSEKEDLIPVKRSARFNVINKLEESDLKTTKPPIIDNKETLKCNKKIKTEATTSNEILSKKTDLKIKQTLETNIFSLETDTSKSETVQPEEPKKPFDIMEHVSMIKVNGVGVLFQCKICNRNFLKKDVVMSHACAKLGAVKIQGPKSFAPSEPPKVPQTVKYITTKVDKELDNSVVSYDKCKVLENRKPISISEPINLDDEEDDKPLASKKSKPKIGPASKVKRNVNSNTNLSSEPPSTSKTNQMAAPSTSANVLLNVSPTMSAVPSVQFPTIPSLNSRYKLMPGPNNTFTLVEEKSDDAAVKDLETHTNTSSEQEEKIGAKTNAIIKTQGSTAISLEKSKTSDNDRPYPVGLIKSISAANPRMPVSTESVTFPTPAMKKQSYTVFQTGNPSKLLISTKPQTLPAEEEVPKKRPRKGKLVAKEDESNKQPFSVTIEDASPPGDPGFFTFINVDPLLQPSYVLPTDNIIQESQISTSTNVSKQNENKDNKYTCNMCNEKFSREKKLLAHIHSHYNKLDEEDQKRAGKNVRKRAKK